MVVVEELNKRGTSRGELDFPLLVQTEPAGA